MRVRLAALSVVGALLTVAPGAYADQTTSFTYVANTVGYYTSLDEHQPDGLAVAGQLRFTPRGRSVTIRIDDLTVLDGQTVPVWVYSPRGGDFARCLQARTDETIRGVRPGKEMIVTILADGAWEPGTGPGCTGHASGGTADVTL